MQQAPVQEKIRLYLGTGCGKTTATFGVMLRALSKGKNVTLVFFDKLAENSSEGGALELLSTIKKPDFGKLNVYYTGINRIGCGPKGSFRFYSSPNGVLPEDRAEAKRGLSLLQQALVAGDDVVIADEMLDVARASVISSTVQLKHHGRALEGIDC